MDSSDYVYGTIFVLYVALFLVIGGYICTRRKRKHLDQGKEPPAAAAAAGSQERDEQQPKDLRSKKKD